MAARPVAYHGVAGVAAWLRVTPATVTQWLLRYDDWPEPDAVTLPGRHGDGDKGWLPERRGEWEAWAERGRVRSRRPGSR